MPWIPLLLGASILGKLFSDSAAASEQESRYATFQRELKEGRARTIGEGTRLINQKTRGQMARGRAATARRLQALGFASEAESFIAPTEQMLASEGDNALKDFIFNTNRYYDQAAIEGAAGFAGRSIAPGAGEYIAELAPAAVSYYESENLLKAVKGAGAVGSATDAVQTQKPEAAVDSVTSTAEPSPNADRVGDQSWAFNFSRRTMDPFSGKDLTRFSRGGLTFGDLAKRSPSLTFGALK